jgi:hypothetical protein
MMSTRRLAQMQASMKAHQPIRRGRVADALRPVEEVPIDVRIFAAMHKLREGKSVALVAIDPRVRLTIERVGQVAEALKAASLL